MAWAAILLEVEVPFVSEKQLLATKGPVLPFFVGDFNIARRFQERIQTRQWWRKIQP